MSDDLADLYPGFASRWIDTSAGRIFARTGGEGPPLLLLHGYPQTNVMWHRVAPALAERFSLVIPDLPGYGWSDVPRVRCRACALHQARDGEGDGRGDGGASVTCASVSPGTTAAAASPIGWRSIIRDGSRQLGGARHRADLDDVAPHGCAAREPGLALDVPGAAGAVSRNADRQGPDLLLRHAGGGRHQDQEPCGVRSAGARALPCVLQRSAAHPRDLRGLSRRPHHRPRARRRVDRATGAKITCPLLAIWGAAGGIPAETEGPLAAWREWATDVRGFPIDCGHYLAEEAPEATAQALLEFFATNRA